MEGNLPDISAESFARDGYLVVRGMADARRCGAMRAAVLTALSPLTAPAEFEADVGYPGSPASRDHDGGDTPRRLLNAYAREPLLRDWATDRAVGRELAALMGSTDVRVSQCHHNCVMTKHPGFSSGTLWHQDIRYWSFDRPELISVWLALGPEREGNGALSVIPGSHRVSLDRGRLDHALFLRPDLPENAALIDGARVVELEAGDALFFHCRLFHAAGTNRSADVKLSVVFTYHDGSNAPIPGTRSAQYPSIPL